MKKIVFVIAIVLGLGATTFYFQNTPTQKPVETKDLSSEISTSAKAITQKEFEKLKSTFSTIEFKKLTQYEIDGLWCKAQENTRTGVAYDYKNKIADLLEKNAKDPLNHYEVSNDKSGNTKFRIIDNGLASLYARLDLIRKAKKSIELEYFIYRMVHKRSVDKIETAMDFIKGEKEKQVNLTTILITRELIKKALENVKVRVLIDASGTVLDFKSDYYTAAHIILRKEAEKMGVDYKKIKNNFIFKHYNVSDKIKTKIHAISKALSFVDNVGTVNLRNHRKLLLVDDKYAMTGGRNIEDKYFDLDPKYNFHDRDVIITYEPNGKAEAGGLLVAIKNSFNAYWNEPYASKEIPFLKGIDIFGHFNTMPTANSDWGKPLGILNKDTSYIEDKVFTVGKSNYENTTTSKSCNNATYVTDKPIDNTIIDRRILSIFNLSNKYKENYRFTGRVMEEVINRTLKDKKNKDILLGSPYLSQNCRTKLITKQLLAAGAKLTAYTNSLASTDAVYNAALFYARVNKFLATGTALEAHSAIGLDKEGIEYVKVKNRNGEFVNPRNQTWGLHSKSHVYSNDAIYIGTYNLDNRSSIYNSEMGVFCEDNKPLAAELKASIDSRIKKSGISITGVTNDSGVLNINGDKVSPYGVASPAEINLMKKIYPIVEKIEFLF